MSSEPRRIDLGPESGYNYFADGEYGKCHLCCWLGTVKYCPKCDHWFCKSCRKLYFRRGLAALKQLIQGKTPGCCGPSKDL